MLDRVHVMFSVLTILGLVASAAACSKTEGATSGAPGAPGATISAPSAMPSAAMAAPDASSATATPADTTTGTAPTADAAVAATASATGTAPKASAAPTGASADLSAANAACGAKGVTPDCPLQAWMKANTNSAIASNDLPALATALDRTATFAPAGYANWASIAKDGAKAAKAGDMTAAKASCRTCHDQYKTKYKAELRGRKI